MYEVMLSSDDMAALARAVKGEGGFQDLLRLLQERRQNSTLRVSHHEAERIVRYAGDYGPGGWEDRLRRIAAELQRQMGDQ